MILRPVSNMPLTKGAALPSKIGTSSLSISINAFDTPQPASAAIRCSIVEIAVPSSFVTLVQSVVFET